MIRCWIKVWWKVQLLQLIATWTRKSLISMHFNSYITYITIQTIDEKNWRKKISLFLWKIMVRFFSQYFGRYVFAAPIQVSVLIAEAGGMTALGPHIKSPPWPCHFEWSFLLRFHRGNLASKQTKVLSRWFVCIIIINDICMRCQTNWML